jgi:hypothetical protein
LAVDDLGQQAAHERRVVDDDDAGLHAISPLRGDQNKSTEPSAPALLRVTAAFMGSFSIGGAASAAGS